MPSLATMRSELVTAAREGALGEIRAHALDLGFAGRSLNDLSENEVEALYFVVWPPAHMPEAEDDTPEARAFNDKIRF